MTPSYSEGQPCERSVVGNMVDMRVASKIVTLCVFIGNSFGILPYPHLRVWVWVGGD